MVGYSSFAPSALIVFHTLCVSVNEFIGVRNKFQLSAFTICRTHLPLAFTRLNAIKSSLVRYLVKVPHALVCSLRTFLHSSFQHCLGLFCVFTETRGMEECAALIICTVIMSVACSVSRWSMDVYKSSDISLDFFQSAPSFLNPSVLFLELQGCERT